MDASWLCWLFDIGAIQFSTRVKSTGRDRGLYCVWYGFPRISCVVTCMTYRTLSKDCAEQHSLVHILFAVVFRVASVTNAWRLVHTPLFPPSQACARTRRLPASVFRCESWYFLVKPTCLCYSRLDGVQVSSHELPPPIWEDLKKDTTAIAQQCYPLQQVIWLLVIGLKRHFWEGCCIQVAVLWGDNPWFEMRARFCIHCQDILATRRCPKISTAQNTSQYTQ